MPKRRRGGGQRQSWEKRRKEDTSPPTNRPSTLKKLKDDNMQAAMQAVRSGQCGANKAARLHNVPPTTLKDQLSGRVKHGDKPGPDP